MINKSITSRRFFLALVFQLALISSVPAQAIYTRLAGEMIVLQTIPVDPYDFLRGYSQTLRYDISRYETLEKLSGWDTLVQQTDLEKGEGLPTDTRFYVILESPLTAETKSFPPTAWKGVAVSLKLPENLPDNQIALEAKADSGWVSYGIETYYMPEDRREEINTAIANLQSDLPFVVEVKVNPQGHSVPVSLWIQGAEYRF